MDLTLNKLFVRVTNGELRPQVIEKSKKDNKIYFLTTTQEIICLGVAYGLSTDVQAQIAKIESILKAYYTDGTENAVSKAIEAVQNALTEYEKTNDGKRALLVKTVAYNAANKTIDFTSEDEKTVQHINVSDIIGNHIVTGSSYDEVNNTLKLKFSAGDKEDTTVDVDIDLSKILDMNDVVSGDATHFEAKYADGKLTIKPVMCNVANAKVAVEGEHATPAVTGLVDALDVKTYIDTAVSGTTTDLQGKIDTINGKLDVINGEEAVDGSIKKALKDAKDYTNTEVQKTNGNLTKEVADREAADKALYGGDIPATDAKTISGNAASIAGLTTTLESEMNARKAADLALYGGDSIPETDAATISGNATTIANIVKAFGDASTFWEDYTL